MTAKANTIGVVSVCAVTDESEFRRCQDILVEVWDLENGGQRNIIPVRLFQISQSYGGLTLAAYLRGGEMVGFAWAFPALDPDGRVFLFSDTLAVLPQHRDRGIGTQLKFAQREWALQHNISMIRWTYDPLEVRNGYLNIVRLGGIARTYYRNAYGVGVSGPNKGVETDRFVIEWHLKSARVDSCARRYRRATPPPDMPCCIALQNNNRNLVPLEVHLDCEESNLLVPLPRDFQALRDEGIDQAAQWRLAMRRVCEKYFALGYAVTDFHVEFREGARQGYYHLSRDWPTATTLEAILPATKLTTDPELQSDRKVIHTT